uniref:Ig-like domain-containing protein n=1 Tax=Trichobilharzia regenti TaxID=157069 RepID=A0AA85IVE2_TRIRE|nr:unnamed protein product [Trichobilharzia regenti]
MEIHEGRRLTLKCKVQGETNPQIKWFKDNKPIDMSLYPNIKITSSTKHSELRIEQVISSDSGNYSCRGESQQSQISKWVFVSVYSACPVNVCNVGTCFIINNNNTLCRCPKSYTGEHCDQLVSNDKITNKLLMNTQPIKQSINSLQSDSKLSVSSSSPPLPLPPSTSTTLTNGLPTISSENNHPRQNIQLLNEMKREKFDLCTLPEFQFTTDCMPVKSHLTTFIGTAITCSVLILLLTFCAAYIRRRRIISRGKQDRQHLSKVQHSESGNVIVETPEDKCHLSTLNPNDLYLKNGPLQLSQLKSLSFEGVLYTELVDNNNNNNNKTTTNNNDNSNKEFKSFDKSYPKCTLTPHYNINRNSPNTLLQQANQCHTVNSLHRQHSINCHVSPTTCSNTAYVVWTSNTNPPEILQQQTSQDISMQPLGKVLIHTDSQGQQLQHAECSNDPLPPASTMTRNFQQSVSSSLQPLSSNNILLNSVSLINQNNFGTLLSSTTNDSVTSTLLSSGSKLCSPVIAQTTDVVSKCLRERVAPNRQKYSGSKLLPDTFC